MEVNFKFEIGRILTTKESIASVKMLEWRNEADRKIAAALNKRPIEISLIVIQRRLDECSGGVQHQYLCHYFTSEGYKEHWFNEIELEEHPQMPKEVDGGKE